MDNYAPDGAHRHYELERVQKEILQQHKRIESQLNLLRDNLRSIGNTVMGNGTTNDNGYVVHTRTALNNNYPSYNNPNYLAINRADQPANLCSPTAAARPSAAYYNNNNRYNRNVNYRNNRIVPF
ncbi:ORF90 [Agrotis segetum granulovirus]|uniref:ORF90 n=1 Tax=Agrotis segetum granulosis virus TaxID=10464 RepID=Q6QXL0_GVAS|nr:hypothetical protein AsGV104 [Agrotis segetum granulovirus]AAS82648.1 ORF90 [Agrotis segetum granulovirus]AHN92141.1 hypothetical protein AsGV102 [Agrotis segetum granulovirus]AKN63378.1 hypothetical protein AsGV104 [Agrotis segetum granulovirus]